MEISVKSLLELIFVVLILKLIVSRWKPPIQESLQAIICITIGTATGFVLNPTGEGFLTGIIASGFAFYGGDLFAEFKTVKQDLREEISEDEDLKDKFQDTIKRQDSNIE